MKQVRRVIHIDETRCNGCGDCITACSEGAIELVDGKARLVSEVYCDGLADCLGTCPVGAITIEEREAEGFDATAASKHASRVKAKELFARARENACSVARADDTRQHRTETDATITATHIERLRAESASGRVHWPVKLILAPTKATFYDGATLVVSADCVAFTLTDFHRRFLGNKPLVIACPKLGRSDVQRIKLTDILTENDVRAVEVLFMEVPCCFGLVHMVRVVLGTIAKDIPLTLTRIGIHGDVLERFAELT